MAKDVKVKVLNFEFLDKIHLEDRTPEFGMPEELLNDIAKKPTMVMDEIRFKINLSVDNKLVELRHTIEKGFCYNRADIPSLLQFVTFDKHSPYVKDASLIHDYLLDNRIDLYTEWHFETLGIHRAQFRKITSEVFKLALIQNAVNPIKATIMAAAVDVFQASPIGGWKVIER